MTTWSGTLTDVFMLSHTIRCIQLTFQAVSALCSDQGDNVVAVSDLLLDTTPNMDFWNSVFGYSTTKGMNQIAETQVRVELVSRQTAA